MASLPIPSQARSLPSTPVPYNGTSNLTDSPQSLPTEKLSTIARFKSLTSNLSLKNQYTKLQEKIVFPPPSWFLDDNTTNLASDEPMRHSPVPVAQAVAEPSDSDREEAPELVSFAMKIRHLIDSLPLPTLARAGTLGFTSKSSSVSTGTQESSDFSGEIPMDGKGPPIPPSVDAELMKLLSSECVMNGDLVGKEGDKRKEGIYRQSVWSVLERLRPASGRIGGEEVAGKEQKDIGDRDPEGGVMMYSPLEPTSDSEVELAVEYVEPDDSRGDTDVGDNKGKGPEQGPGPLGAPKAPTYEKVWVPSTTKLSLYTTWWGYRLYLPPPVMEKLGSTNVKATARAAMVTTALKWLLDRLPLMMVPPTLKPTVILLKRLSPLIGYIGVFIAWSWSRITTYDKGNGVMLTATWLLPVALIPSSWDAGDIHGPSLRPSNEDEQEEATTTKASLEKKGGK